jgi:hypothetical protein
MSRFEINTTIDGFSRVDFDKKPIKKTMRSIGQKVQTDARRLVARKAISGAGEYPGKATGTLQKSTKFKLSKPGFLVTIAPRQNSGTVKAGEFYPGILYYGVRRGSVRRKDKKKQTGNGTWRIAPRGNHVVDAAENRRAWAQSAIAESLQTALIWK